MMSQRVASSIVSDEESRNGSQEKEIGKNSNEEEEGGADNMFARLQRWFHCDGADSPVSETCVRQLAEEVAEKVLQSNDANIDQQTAIQRRNPKLGCFKRISGHRDIPTVVNGADLRVNVRRIALSVDCAPADSTTPGMEVQMNVLQDACKNTKELSLRKEIVTKDDTSRKRSLQTNKDNANCDVAKTKRTNSVHLKTVGDSNIRKNPSSEVGSVRMFYKKNATAVGKQIVVNCAANSGNCERSVVNGIDSAAQPVLVSIDDEDDDDVVILSDNVSTNRQGLQLVKKQCRYCTSRKLCSRDGIGSGLGGMDGSEPGLGGIKRISAIIDLTVDDSSGTEDGVSCQSNEANVGKKHNECESLGSVNGIHSLGSANGKHSLGSANDRGGAKDRRSLGSAKQAVGKSNGFVMSEKNVVNEAVGKLRELCSLNQPGGRRNCKSVRVTEISQHNQKLHKNLPVHGSLPEVSHTNDLSQIRDESRNKISNRCRKSASNSVRAGEAFPASLTETISCCGSMNLASADKARLESDRTSKDSGFVSPSGLDKMSDLWDLCHANDSEELRPCETLRPSAENTNGTERCFVECFDSKALQNRLGGQKDAELICLDKNPSCSNFEKELSLVLSCQNDDCESIVESNYQDVQCVQAHVTSQSDESRNESISTGSRVVKFSLSNAVEVSENLLPADKSLKDFGENSLTSDEMRKDSNEQLVSFGKPYRNLRDLFQSKRLLPEMEMALKTRQMKKSKTETSVACELSDRNLVTERLSINGENKTDTADTSCLHNTVENSEAVGLDFIGSTPLGSSKNLFSSFSSCQSGFSVREEHCHDQIVTNVATNVTSQNLIGSCDQSQSDSLSVPIDESEITAVSVPLKSLWVSNESDSQTQELNAIMQLNTDTVHTDSLTDAASFYESKFERLAEHSAYSSSSPLQQRFGSEEPHFFTPPTSPGLEGSSRVIVEKVNQPKWDADFLGEFTRFVSRPWSPSDGEIVRKHRRASEDSDEYFSAAGVDEENSERREGFTSETAERALDASSSHGQIPEDSRCRVTLNVCNQTESKAEGEINHRKTTAGSGKNQRNCKGKESKSGGKLQSKQDVHCSNKNATFVEGGFHRRQFYVNTQDDEIHCKRKCLSAEGRNQDDNRYCSSKNTKNDRTVENVCRKLIDKSCSRVHVDSENVTVFRSEISQPSCHDSSTPETSLTVSSLHNSLTISFEPDYAAEDNDEYVYVGNPVNHRINSCRELRNVSQSPSVTPVRKTSRRRCPNRRYFDSEYIVGEDITDDALPKELQGSSLERDSVCSDRILVEGGDVKSDSPVVNGLDKSLMDCDVIQSNADCMKLNASPAKLKPSSNILDFSSNCSRVTLLNSVQNHNELLRLRGKICSLFSLLFPSSLLPSRFLPDTVSVERLLDGVISVLSDRPQKPLTLEVDAKVFLCCDAACCLANVQRKILSLGLLLFPSSAELSSLRPEHAEQLLDLIISANQPTS